MYNLKLPILLMIGLFFVGCANNEENHTEDAEKSTKKTEENCQWTYDETSTLKLAWKAFKTTEKIGVGGEFTNVIVTSKVTSTELKEVLKGVKFKANVASTSTGDATRDPKIVEFFFGKMMNTEMIEGAVKSISGTNEAGMVVFELKMNDVVHDAPMKYTFNDGTLLIEGTIDVNDWKAQDAVASLNKACFDLHKGKDGVSKTWSVVDINVKVDMSKKCD